MDPKYTDLTVAQAGDLANHFLGSDWDASVVKGDPPAYLLRNVRKCIVLTNSSWRKVFADAGVQLPHKLEFVQRGSTVRLGEKIIAQCCSNKYAARIRDALNADGGG